MYQLIIVIIYLHLPADHWVLQEFPTRKACMDLGWEITTDLRNNNGGIIGYTDYYCPNVLEVK